MLFPRSNLHTARKRLALVAQADHLDTGIAEVIVAMITSLVFRAEHPSRVTVLRVSSAGQQSELLGQSVGS